MEFFHYCRYRGMLEPSKMKKSLIMIAIWTIFALSLILLLKTCWAETCREPTTCDGITHSPNVTPQIHPNAEFEQERQARPLPVEHKRESREALFPKKSG